MIKNILFDMGGVLLYFEPKTFVSRLGLGREDALALEREVFHSWEWVMLDRGTLTHPQALESICRRLPERLHTSARELMDHWDEPRVPMEEMSRLVEELSGEGYNLCLLSNAGLRHHSYWPKLPVARFFGDRVMISADWKLLKPEPAFYQKALSLFSLTPSECLFIDDNPSNAEAAIREGIDTIVYHGEPSLLRVRLREKGIRVSA